MPLRGTGRAREHVVAFTRRRERTWVIALASRRTTRISSPGHPPVGEVWGGAGLRLPDGAPLEWRDAITDAIVHARAGHLPLAGVFGRLPVALLVAERPGGRTGDRPR